MLEGSNILLSENPIRAELARELLLYKMREYSEAMCASWLAQAEFDIWENGSPDDTNPELLPFHRANGLECRKLGEIANGWWISDTENRVINQTGDVLRMEPHFIPLPEWMAGHARIHGIRLLESRQQAQEAEAHGFTPEAAERWKAFSESEPDLFLKGMWCEHCRTMRRVEVTGGNISFIGELFLTGTCPACGGLIRYRHHTT